MKKYIYLSLCLIGAIIFIYGAKPQTAYAETAPSTYLRVLKEDVCFYEDANCTEAAFFLPYTYYVKVISFSNPFCEVECYNGDGGAALFDGYIKTSELSETETVPSAPYLKLNLTLKTSAVVYADPECTVVLRNVFSERSMEYYGSYKKQDGTPLSFIRYGDTFGYVETSHFNAFSVPLNADPLPNNSTDSNSDDNGGGSGSKGFKIAIIVIMSLAALLILVSVFVRPKKKTEPDDEG